MKSLGRVKPAGFENKESGFRRRPGANRTLLARKTVRRPVEPGRHALLKQKTFDEKLCLDGQRSGAEGSRERQLALVGDFLNVHPAGLGMADGKREATFPVVHPVVRAMLLLGIRHRLGKSPHFPLQILGHAGGVESDVVLSDPGDHIFGSNDS